MNFEGGVKMSTSLLRHGNSYEAVYSNFKWNIPENYNIAYDVCDRWAEDQDRIALVYEDELKNQKVFFFHEVKKYANQLANLFTGLGLKKGDVVTLLLAQDPMASTHMGPISSIRPPPLRKKPACTIPAASFLKLNVLH